MHIFVAIILLSTTLNSAQPFAPGDLKALGTLGKGDISVQRRGKRYDPADFATVSEYLGALGSTYRIEDNVFMGRRIAVAGALNIGQQIKDEDSNHYHNALISLNYDIDFWNYLTAMLGAVWDFERFAKEANKSGGTVAIRYRVRLDTAKLNPICKETFFVVTDNYCQVVVYGKVERAKVAFKNVLGQRVTAETDLLTVEDIALLSKEGRLAAIDMTGKAAGFVLAIRDNARKARSLFD